ncbi:MAG TPA: cellulose synthase subunit BcsC-related outer membrane protein [Roseococcus sp.]|jgi:tetratricopeptide (TPR) repeat protein|nr:cellulose synthase subunit BcsC-related outer membrane protein [Roseococcus sp.]
MQRLRATLLLGGAVLVPASGLAQAVPPATNGAAVEAGAAQGGPSRAVDILLRQAERWLSLEQNDQAAAAVQRALAADPRNAEALALSARIEAARGNQAGAAALTQRLRDAGATPEQTRAAEQAVRGAAIDRNALEEARALARAGRAEEAAARYRAIFGAQGPTPPFAQEYFQALAATRAGAAEGRRGLETLADRPDASPRVRLAAAQTLTFQPGTRAEGIRRLVSLADNPEVAAEARAAWRQALVWSAGDPAFVDATQAYLQRFPADAELRRSLAAIPRPDPAAEARQEAFQRLEAGAATDAARRFEAILATSPNDADALGGLGIVRLREGRAAEARRLLEQAVAADPSRAQQWQPALDGAAYGLELAAGRAALNRGRLDEADEIARSAARRQVEDRTDIEVLLGDIALRRRDFEAAEQRYRAALARRPAFAPAQIGLNAALRGQGRPGIALPQTAGGGGGPPATPGEAGRLRAEAARATDAGVAAALLRQAVELAPDDTWLRLDLARVLRRQGRAIEGRALMEELAARRGGRDDLFAAALLAEEEGRLTEAEGFLNRIPPAQRSADMGRLATGIRAQRDVQRAAQGLARSAPEARVQLVTLAARPDPTGATAAAVVRAFADANDRFGAAEAARVGEAANRAAGPTPRLAIAGALLAAGLDAEALALADQVEQGRVTAEQRRDIASLRAGAAIRASDRLNNEGNQAQAFEQLRPVLQRDPDNTEARLALARLHQGAREPAEALRIAEGILARNPRSLDARQAALDAAVALRDFNRAEALVTEGLRLHPRDSRMSVLEARYARATNNEARARRALEQAAEARRAELGFQTMPGTPGLPPAMLPNPFARAGAVATSTPAPGVPQDRVSREIATELASLERETGFIVTATPSFRQRSGSAGLDRMQSIIAPVEAEITPPGIGGRLTARMTGVSLDTGTLGTDVATRIRFGGNPLLGAGAGTPRSNAAGVNVGVAYRRDDWLRADVTSSPIGFPRATILGGVELAPQIGGVRLRVVGERRSVQDSLLSWAGQRDRLAGRDFGMVVRTGGRAQVEIPVGPGFAYVGGGYSIFEGQEVARNTRVEAGAGISYPILRSEGGELTVGGDLVYFGYQRNLRFFTLGHGGYYSPQSFFAANIPVDYRGRAGDFTYRIGGTAGFAVWRENPSDVFPNNRFLQNQLIAAAAQDATNTLITRYPGQSQQNFIAGLRGNIDYAITPRINLGAGFQYDKSANWDETVVQLRLQGRF